MFFVINVFCFFFEILMKKKGYFFVSGPEGDKNPSCIEIYVQKVGVEMLRKLRGNLLDFAAENIEVLELTIFYR